jgi:hypothetical protein
MLLRGLFIGAAFATAIAVTAIFTSFAASSANAAGAGNFAIERTIPNYMLRWENPMLPPTPMTPILGQ